MKKIFKKRKKLSEMTPFERVASRMKYMSFDEAEDVGIEIMARVVAIRMYAESKDGQYLQGVFERIIKQADDYARNEGSLYLALIKLNLDKMKEKKKA